MRVFDPRSHKEEDLVSEETESPPEHPSVTLTRKIFRTYKQNQTTWSERAAKSRAYVHNKMFSEEQVDGLAQRGQAATAINVLWPAMEQAVAMLTANNPSFQVTAREDSDVRTARAASDLLSYEWYHSDGGGQLKDSLYDYYTTGRGVLQTYIDPHADYGRGAVRFRSLDASRVFPDPNSRDKLWRDAAHILVHNLMTAEQILSVWPDAKEMIASANSSYNDEADFSNEYADTDGWRFGRGTLDDHHTHFEVIERYSRVVVEYRHIVETGQEEKILMPDEVEEYMAKPALVVAMEGQQPMFFGGDHVEAGMEMVQSLQPTEEEGVFVYVDEQSGQQVPVQVQQITNGKLIEQNIMPMRKVVLPRILYSIAIGNKLYYEHYLPTQHYPIIPIMGRWNRNPYPMSDVEFVRPLQDSINKIHIQLVANLASSTNVKVIGPRGSFDREQVERDMAKAGTAVLEMDFEYGEPKIVAPLPPPSGLFSYLDMLVQMVERELGVFSVQQGDPNNAPATYKGTLAIDEYGQRRIKSKLDDIEQALTQLGRVMLELCQHVYTEERTIRIVGPNNTERPTTLNAFQYTDLSDGAERMNDITLGEYDVIVVSGSTLPSNRYALLDYYIELKREGIVDEVEVLKKTDVADAEAVLERIGQVAQLNRALEGAQEEIKRLQGDLQTAHRQELNALKRVELEKTKGDLKGPQAQARAATYVHSQRLGDELQMLRSQQSEEQ